MAQLGLWKYASDEGTSGAKALPDLASHTLWWRPRTRAQVGQDLLDHRSLEVRRDDLELAAVVRALHRRQDVQGRAARPTYQSTPKRSLLDTRSWPGPGFPGGHPKQTLAGWAVALKVIFLAPRRIHTGGQLRTSDRPEMGPTNDRFESTADMGRRPLAGAHPPTWSLKGLAVVASGDDSCRRKGTHRWTRQDQLGLLDPLRPARAHPCCVALTAGLQRPFAVGQGCIVRPRQALRSRCLSKSRRASNSSG